MNRFLPLALVALLLAGCGKRDMETAAVATEPMAPAGEAMDSARGAPPNMGGLSAEAGAEPMLASAPQLNEAAAAKAKHRAVIRNGALSVRVDSVEKREKEVARLVKALGGYVANTESTDLASENPTLNLSLRVPSDDFEAAMAALEGLGTRLSMRTTTEDVTAQLVDLGARLKIMLAQEDAFRNMLKKASRRQEIMDIQSRIMDLRAQIESLAAQQKSLSSLATLSKIDLTLEQSAAGTAGAAAAAGDPNWAQEAWGSATTAFMSVARGAGTFGIWLLLFSPIWLPALLILRWILRSHRRPEPQS